MKRIVIALVLGVSFIFADCAKLVSEGTPADCESVSECLCSDNLDTSAVTPACFNWVQKCCPPNLIDVTSSVLGLGSEASGGLEASDSCICLPVSACVNVGQVTSNEPCTDPSNVCCSLNVTEEDFLSGIFGEPTVGADTLGGTDECKCVPNDKCQPAESDLSSLVNVRTGFSGQVCQDSTFICCYDNELIDSSLPIGPDPSLPEACTCVPSDTCSEHTEDLSLIVNLRTNVRTSICSGSKDVCCPNSQIVSHEPFVEQPPVAVEPPVPVVVKSPVSTSCQCVDINSCRQTLDSAGGCLSASHRCCEPENIIVEEVTKPVKQISCGQSHESNIRIDVRLRGGFQSKFAEFPWMVAVYEEKNGSSNYTCGGSLIHPSVVLTTAHCIQKDSKMGMSVRAGDWDIDSISEKYPYEQRYVSARVLHPKYSNKSLANNVALLILEEPIQSHYHINTICLPSSEFVEHSSACMVSGWGKDNFGDDGRLQTTLKKIHVPFVDHAYCQKALRTTRLGARFRLGSTFVCAGGARDDACTGDGGSPLVCPMTDGSNRYVQLGAVAWGIECGNPDVPGVYSSIVSAMPWIRDFMTKQFGPQSLNYFT